MTEVTSQPSERKPALLERVLVAGSWLAAVASGSAIFLAFWNGEGLGVFLVWFAVSAAIAFGAASSFAHFVRDAEILVRNRSAELLSFSGAASGDVSERQDSGVVVLIKKHLSPRLEVLRGLEAVCREAAATIEEAHSEAEDQFRFVTFYGSASLSTVDPQRGRFGYVRESPTFDEDIQTPEQIYSGALEAAASDQVRIRRYIRLLTADELAERGVGFRREYVQWLRGQYYQLGRNANYRLTNVIRAPAWGAGLARIVTHRRLLELVASGDAGILIVGPELAETIRRQARLSVLGSGGERNPPRHYGQTKPWGKLVGEVGSVDDFKTQELEPAVRALDEVVGEAEH